MTAASPRGFRRVLEPNDRVSEVLFGLIMVLTFTGSLSVADAGRDDVRTMLIGALGCNLAWGVIDGVLYLMGCLADRGSRLRTLRAMRATTDPARAQQLIRDALPLAASVMEPAEIESLRQRLLQLPAPPGRVPFERDDWLGAVAVFAIVFLSTFPVALPFLLMDETRPAMRVSNAVAVAMLFVAGAAYGRVIDRAPWVVGLAMVGLGLLLVALTIALGG
jgi:hypothetical protein